jgi:hypothetical protein
MTESIYIYTLVAQEGSGTIHFASGASQAVRQEPVHETTANAAATGRDANAITSQASALAAHLLRPVPESIRHDMGLFLGTCFGCIEDDRMFQESRLADGGKFASPAAFRRTLPSTVPAELSIAFGIHGPLITYADANTPAMLPIIRAVQWIASGHISTAIAGSYDYYSGGEPRYSDRPEICRTLLCLIAKRAAFPEMAPWAVISFAGITSGAPTGQAASHSDFAALLQAAAMTKHSRHTIHCASATGAGYNLTLDI